MHSRGGRKDRQFRGRREDRQSWVEREDRRYWGEREDRRYWGEREDRQAWDGEREERQPRQESHYISIQEYPMLRSAGNGRRGALAPPAWE